MTDDSSTVQEAPDAGDEGPDDAAGCLGTPSEGETFDALDEVYWRTLLIQYKRTPSQPTKARPGSEEKVRVLVARAERGEDLWHPDDESLLAEKRNFERGGRPAGG